MLLMEAICLRKAIDYFSHLSVQPEWYSDMIKDEVIYEFYFCIKTEMVEG